MSYSIEQEYKRLGGSTGVLGNTVGPIIDKPDGTQFQRFEHGEIHTSWIKPEEKPDIGVLGKQILESPMTEIQFMQKRRNILFPEKRTMVLPKFFRPVACAVYGFIYEKWKLMGGENSILGIPTESQETCRDGIGIRCRFKNGSIYALQGTAYAVYGPILTKWTSLGRDFGVLGYPISDVKEFENPNGQSCHFQNGSIFSEPSAGTFVLNNRMTHAFQSLYGGPGGVLGFPISDETATTDGRGVYHLFQNGILYDIDNMHLPAGVHSGFLIKYRELGMQTGPLGYPLEKESYIGDGSRKKFMSFEGGRIYWNTEISVPYNVTAVYGAICNRYRELGHENSFLGFPKTDEVNFSIGSPNNSRVSYFEGGGIFFGATSKTNYVCELSNPFVQAFQQNTGFFGYPMSFLADYKGGQRAKFFTDRFLYYFRDHVPQITMYDPTDINSNPVDANGVQYQLLDLSQESDEEGLIMSWTGQYPPNGLPLDRNFTGILVHEGTLLAGELVQFLKPDTDDEVVGMVEVVPNWPLGTHATFSGEPLKQLIEINPDGGNRLRLKVRVLTRDARVIEQGLFFILKLEQLR